MSMHYPFGMTQINPEGFALEPGLDDRLGMALRSGGVSVSEMSDELGLSRATISAYLHGRRVPKPAILKMWALRTGASYEWLSTGSYPKAQGNQHFPDNPGYPNYVRLEKSA